MLTWADFGTRNRALGARLQQVTQPGDRVAILCPQNLDYLVAFFGTLYPVASRCRCSTRPNRPRGSSARRARRLPAVGDPDHHRGRRGRAQVLPQPSGQGTSRVIAVDAIPDEVGATWQVPEAVEDTIAYLQYTSGSTRVPSGVQITHLNLATNVVQVIEALEGEEADRGCPGCRSSTTWAWSPRSCHR